MNNSTKFNHDLMTITGCNEATAQYMQLATGGHFSRLKGVCLVLLSESQKRKMNSLIDVIRCAYDYSAETVKITHSSDVYNLLHSHFDGLQHEEMWCVFMNQAGVVLHTQQLSKGGMSGTIVDIKIILRVALECRATRLILVHNHPSGSPRPSQQDIHLTSKVKHAADLMDIRLTDHIVIANDSYFSFLDEGML